MRELLECLRRWLDEQHDDSNALDICRALVRESIKRADSADKQQSQFNALDLAPATVSGERYSDDYDSAKRWFDRANVAEYLESRRARIEAHFAEAGFSQALVLCKTSTAGKHRVSWFLAAYDLSSKDREVDTSDSSRRTGDDPKGSKELIYQLTKPAEIRLSWLGKLLTGDGEFRTHSWRGMVWAFWLVLASFMVILIGWLYWQMHAFSRPITTGDLVLLTGLMAAAWVCWRFVVRPMVLLLSDRITPAGDLLTAWTESPCQLEMAKTENGRVIRVVRYSAICPICAGQIELEYGYGHDHRRLFGRCNESPQEHAFTFDRITLKGHSIH